MVFVQQAIYHVRTEMRQSLGTYSKIWEKYTKFKRKSFFFSKICC